MWSDWVITSRFSGKLLDLSPSTWCTISPGLSARRSLFRYDSVLMAATQLAVPFPLARCAHLFGSDFAALAPLADLVASIGAVFGTLRDPARTNDERRLANHAKAARLASVFLFSLTLSSSAVGAERGSGLEPLLAERGAFP